VKAPDLVSAASDGTEDPASVAQFGPLPGPRETRYTGVVEASEWAKAHFFVGFNFVGFNMRLGNHAGSGGVQN